MLATIIVSFIASLPVPLAQDPVVETPREAYVEGWFQETAEAHQDSPVLCLLHEQARRTASSPPAPCGAWA